ncbi:pre-rRNA 2'-O-ribose RNA methyltransferase FTSJ3 [Trichonephila clavipes]|nr:pre-rRNA 2'-O-ribose RNA methyltransferase FTSJ3 [Trichonephila clavipes]
MIIKNDEPIIDEDQELFRLTKIKDKNDLGLIDEETNLEIGSDPDQSDLDDIAISKYRSTKKRYDTENKDLSYVEAEPEKEESDYSSDEGLSSELEFENESEIEDVSKVTETILEGKKNPLVVDLVKRPERIRDTVDQWFDNQDFAEENEDSDLEIDLLAEEFGNKQKVVKAKKADEWMDEETQEGISSELLESENEKGVPNGLSKSENKKENISMESVPNDLSESENEKDIPNGLSKSEKKKAKKEKKRKRVKLDAEGLALGSLLVQSKKMKRDIIENGYNRFASNDENLPAWFVQDERKHYRKQLPVTAEMAAEYKQRMREINARPIKKVVEAKARKKRRANRRMEKAKKRAEKITEHPDMSVQEKAYQLKEIYKKALPKQDNNVKYIVAKKGLGRRVRRPAGVKGRFKVVDPRMKKDNRKTKVSVKSRKGKPSKQNTRKMKRQKKT